MLPVYREFMSMYEDMLEQTTLNKLKAVFSQIPDSENARAVFNLYMDTDGAVVVSRKINEYTTITLEMDQEYNVEFVKLYVDGQEANDTFHFKNFSEMIDFFLSYKPLARTKDDYI